MKLVKQIGIIINRRVVGDADRFYTILTPDSGKISVYAKSVRSIKSKRGSALDLFNKISFEVVEKGERRTLTHVDLLDNFQAGKKTLHNISRLFQIGELVDSLLPEDDPHLEAYELLEKALFNLSFFDSSEYILRFKKRILIQLGYWSDTIALNNIDSYIESIINKPLHNKII